jgi:hypothetical protein
MIGPIAAAEVARAHSPIGHVGCSDATIRAADNGRRFSMVNIDISFDADGGRHPAAFHVLGEAKASEESSA